MANAARNDLDEIYDYIAQDNPEEAEVFLLELVRQMEKLAVSGMMGRKRDELQPGIRSFPFKKRCFYFFVEEDMFRVVRILHSRQFVGLSDFEIDS